MPLFAPIEAKAGFFTSILGTEASAKTFPNLNQKNENSQTMQLLQANVASIPVFHEAKEKTNKTIAKAKKDTIDTSANINVISDSALLAPTSPLSTFKGTVVEDIGIGGADFPQTNVYVIRNGDSISQIADMFGVSVDTILSVNELKKGSELKEGDVLLILPFSGVEHTVTKGQTLKGIASLYKVDLEEILSANDISVDVELSVGEKLIIPGAEIENEPATPKTNQTKKIATGKGKVSESLPNVTGFFKNPVPGAIRTRGIKPGHEGVDLAAPTGTPIHAVASGYVLTARNDGYNGGFGKMVIIQHSNGCKTLYAHMSKVGTNTGAEVSQGEVIGYIGSTGHSTGPHLHIETPGCKNPF